MRDVGVISRSTFNIGVPDQSSTKGGHCPICRIWTKVEDSFYCKQCERPYLHAHHRDAELGVCIDCGETSRPKPEEEWIFKSSWRHTVLGKHVADDNNEWKILGETPGEVLIHPDYILGLRIWGVSDETICGVVDEISDEGRIRFIELKYHLEHIQKNKVTDTVLNKISSLTQLTHLSLEYLFGTDCTEKGLVELNQLVNLSFLSLSNCQLNLKHLNNLKNLSVLSLQGYSGSDLAFIKSFSNLNIMSITYSEIRNEDITHLASLKALKVLDLSGCWGFSNAGLEYLHSLPNLVILDIGNCREITDEGMVHVGKITGLSHLTLSSCEKISDTGIKHMRSLVNLVYLDLAGCDLITSDGLRQLNTLNNLEYLNISHCDSFDDEGLSIVDSWTNLTHLNLSMCDQITDGGLQYCVDLNRLDSLDLSFCRKITKGSFVYLGQIRNLTKLDLDYTYSSHPEVQLADLDLAHLSALENLDELKLEKCDQVTDNGLLYLRSMKKLTRLELDDCNLVSDSGLVHLQSLTNLTSIKIGGSQIIGKGLRYLSALPKLAKLSLIRCYHLRVDGLSNISLLSNLRSLSLQVGNLQNDHLVHLRSLKLTELNLSYNIGDDRFSDHGLASIGNIKTLRNLCLTPLKKG